MCSLRSLLLVFTLLFNIIHPFDLSVKVFLFPYLAPELFYFLCIRLLIYPCVFSPDLLAEFSFIILEGPILFVLLEPASVFFNPSSFTNIFTFISSSFSVSLDSCCLFSVFLFQCAFVYFSFLSTFSCSSIYFICSSSLISYPAFGF